MPKQAEDLKDSVLYSDQYLTWVKHIFTNSQYFNARLENNIKLYMGTRASGLALTNNQYEALS